MCHTALRAYVKYFFDIVVGKTSNHAVVMAHLIIDGKNHGMHAFMVQLRDTDTHEPMPGRSRFITRCILLFKLYVRK